MARSRRQRSRPPRPGQTAGRHCPQRAAPGTARRVRPADASAATRCSAARPVRGPPPTRQAGLVACHRAHSSRASPVTHQPATRMRPPRATPASPRPAARTRRPCCRASLVPAASPRFPAAGLDEAAAAHGCGSGALCRARRPSARPPPAEPAVRSAAGRAARCPSGPGAEAKGRRDPALAGLPPHCAGLRDLREATTRLYRAATHREPRPGRPRVAR